jgi:hypothetical protein
VTPVPVRFCLGFGVHYGGDRGARAGGSWRWHGAAVIGAHLVALAHGLAAVLAVAAGITGRSQIGRAEGRISWPPGSDFLCRPRLHTRHTEATGLK